MKAAVLRGIRKVAIEDVPAPDPGPGEALVRVTCVGVCGSDVHYYAHGRIGDAVVKPGQIVGHEFAGVVEKTGERLPGDPDIAPGTRVAVEPSINCGHCDCCVAGHPNQCPNVRFYGTPPVQGAFAEYVCHPLRLLFPASGDLTDADIAQIEPLGVGIHTIVRAQPAPGDTVAVFGCGPIGLFTIQCARAGGASRILATDILGYRLDLAKKIGADEVMDASSGGVPEWVMSLTGRGADITYDCAGKQESIDDCMAAVRIGGRAALVGIPRDDRVSYEPHHMRRKELDVLNIRRSRFAVEPGLAMASAGQVDLRSMVTHDFGLDDIAKAFEIVDGYADGVIKAMIHVSDS